MNTYWAIISLYTGTHYRIEAADAAWFNEIGITVRLMGEGEGA